MSAVAEPVALSPEQILEYLRRHPNFLRDNPELLEILTPPERQQGDNVVDFQKHMASSLQKGMQGLKQKYEGLIVSSRDNMSTLAQVHQAAIALVKARNLEQLLEVITLDLSHWFDVDVVRLAMESAAPEFYETWYTEKNYSGLSFIERGVCDIALLGKDKQALLVENVTKTPVYGFSQIFADCDGLVNSCALLRMSMPLVNKTALLAFGVREADRFHPHHAVDLLQFLARIVEIRLDQCLSDSELEKLV